MYDPLKTDLNGVEIFCFAFTFMSEHYLKVRHIGNVLKSNL